MKLKPVTATSEDKNELYQTLVILFNNVSVMAQTKSNGWSLEETTTDIENDYFLTKYNNGKMWILAVSDNDKHLYSYGAI